MTSPDNMLRSPQPADCQPRNTTEPTPPPPIATVVVVPAPQATMPATGQQPEHGSTTPTLANLTWDKIDIDSAGNATGVFGINFTQFSSKQLRSICSRLNIRGVKNVKKQIMIDHIVNHVKNRKAYDSIDAPSQNSGSAEDEVSPTATTGATTTVAPTRKEIQCSFRLMNILFSDQFAERFAATGNVASRDLLDTGMAANDQLFWQAIHAVFVSNTANPVFDQLLFTDDPVFSLQADDINLSKIVPHEWKKLRSIWKSSHK